MLSSQNPIDWQDILRITNNKPELAKQMVSMFAEELPGLQADINTAFEQKNYDTLLDKIHKLHGSCCYCGVPKLKRLAAELESDLKQSKLSLIEDKIQILNQEISHLSKFMNQEILNI